MPLTAASLLGFARDHLLAKRDHVAIVCSGRRSEQWFNGEVRIALNERYAHGTWKWVVIEEGISGGRIDAFVMDGEKDNQADGAIEGKHAQHHDSDADLAAMCRELRRQIKHRKRKVPNCPVIGLIYATHTYQVSDEAEAAADEDGVTCEIVDTERDFYRRVRDAAVSIFGEEAVSAPLSVFEKGHAGLGNWRILTSLALIAVDGDKMSLRSKKSRSSAKSRGSAGDSRRSTAKPHRSGMKSRGSASKSRRSKVKRRRSGAKRRNTTGSRRPPAASRR